MSVRILWRSAIFVLTLGLIYILFPILIVPSSLPVIKAMFIERESPSAIISQEKPDVQIYELNVPKMPTLKEKIELLKDLHQEGMNLIFQK